MSDITFPTLDADLIDKPAPVSERTALAKLDVQAVALARFGDWRASATALVEKYKEAAFDTGSVRGLKALTEAIAEVRAPRFAAQNVSEASKSELAKVSKAIGAEKDAVTAFLKPTEDRLVAIKEAHLTKLKADEEAKAAAEAERKAKHEAGLAQIRSYAAMANGLPAAKIKLGIDALLAMDFNSGWEEYMTAAVTACRETIQALDAMRTAAEAREAEAARLKAEREELDRQRAEQKERDRQAKAEAARIAAEQAERQRALDEREAAILKAEQEREVERQRIAAEAAESALYDQMGEAFAQAVDRIGWSVATGLRNEWIIAFPNANGDGIHRHYWPAYIIALNELRPLVDGMAENPGQAPEAAQNAQESGFSPADAPACTSSGAEAAEALPSGSEGTAARAEECAAEPAFREHCQYPDACRASDPRGCNVFTCGGLVSAPIAQHQEPLQSAVETFDQAASGAALPVPEEWPVTLNTGRAGVGYLTMRAALDGENIFSIEKREGDHFLIKEECDEWYEALLTKDQLLLLIAELQQLADAP